MRSMDRSKVHFAEGGSRLFLLGLKEEEMLVCRDAKEVCEQRARHLLVLSFGGTQRIGG